MNHDARRETTEPPLMGHLWPVRHRGLLLQMTLRDVAARYRQTWLGWSWVVLAPLLMLVVYTLVFRQIFQVRWSPADESSLAFALRIYAGLALFNFFAEYVNRAPTLISEQTQLVKKVVFPLQILPWVNLLSGLIGLGVAAVTLCVLSLLGTGRLPVTVIALVVIWLPLLPLCLGLGWALSALGVYVRDIGQIVGAVLTALVFVSPVFFPVQALPRAAQAWIWLNPLADPMTQTRRVLLEGLWPDWHGWAVSMLVGSAVAVAGALLFRRLRHGFADVL